MIGKRLINTGVAAADALVPSENFNTVLYTGNGSTQRIGGYINRGAVFNGSSSKITSSVPKSSDQSFSFWTNHGSQSNSTATYFGYSNSASNGFFSISISSGTNISILYWNGSTYARNTSTINIADNNWHHVVVTTSGNVFNIYIDGNTTPAYTTTLSGFTHASRSDLQISYETPDGSSSYFNGKIDQFRVFDKVISSSEVTTLYGETHASTTISTTDIFSDGSGVALYQLDGNANDTGGASGKFGSAAIFNGNGRIDTNTVFTSMVGSSTSYSISAWIYPTSNTTARPFGTENSTDGFLIQTSNGNIKAGGGNGSYNFTSDYTCAINQWHHICLVITTNSSIKLYVDNVLKETLSTTISFSGSARLFLGADYNTASGENPFTGKIDDVRIYSDVLTSTEVGYLYNNTTASIPTDNLVAYYKLDGDARDEQQLYDGTATNVTYAYDGTATNVTYQEATKFQPDLIWIKSRYHSTYAFNHTLFDSVRGANEAIYSNLTLAEQTSVLLPSFDSNGFTVSTTGGGNTNWDTATYAAWCFKGGGTAVSNTDGSITSSVSANQDAGFSIVKYTGNGTSGSTIGHGLSDTPQMMISKRTDSGDNWNVYTEATGNTGILYLNLTDAFTTVSNRFNNTSPTSTVFTVGNSTAINVSGGEYIAYCFHSVEGFSKIGSYTGNGSSSGTIVETGFEPAFVMIKRTDGTAGNWFIFDNERSTTNERDDFLHPNSNATETTNSAAYSVDFLSNGFQIKGNGDQINGNNGTHIYLAIAADPDTTTPVVENSFDVVTYTGTGAAQDIDTDFKPDLVWIKGRSDAEGARLFDSIRGANQALFSNATGAESTVSNELTAINEDGFTLGSSENVNQSSQTYVAWCWKAGDHDDNLPQINTEGSIDSVVSVNAESGFSIVKYTGNSTAGATIGHGLSSAPELTIIKKLDTVGYSGGNWVVGYGSYNTDLYLNSTAAAGTNNYFWNAAPTSTVVELKNDWFVNYNGSEYIMYNFHSVSGYQKIGSYTGTGATGNVINVGFKPRFLMWKKTNGAVGWFLLDGVRNTTDVWSARLEANNSGAEAGPDSYTVTVSNTGFEMTGSFATWTGSNELNSTYIYLAIK